MRSNSALLRPIATLTCAQGDVLLTSSRAYPNGDASRRHKLRSAHTYRNSLRGRLLLLEVHGGNCEPVVISLSRLREGGAKITESRAPSITSAMDT